MSSISTSKSEAKHAARQFALPGSVSVCVTGFMRILLPPFVACFIVVDAKDGIFHQKGFCMSSSDIIARIEERKAKLVEASKKLKDHFVGIDHAIDRVINNIEAWYCTPELMTRPTICCLWGLTGIGKTDLVRRLISHLDMTDSFVELQMTNKGSSQHTNSTTLQHLLSTSNVTADDHGVLLLDEIQRFRSVDTQGNDIHDYSFQDLWMLLSDGSFGSAADNKQQIMELLLDAAYWDDRERVEREKKEAEARQKGEQLVATDDEFEKRRRYKQSHYSARQIKRRLRLPESVEEIMQWSGGEKIEMIRKRDVRQNDLSPRGLPEVPHLHLREPRRGVPDGRSNG
jgi:hypothetical protein